MEIDKNDPLWIKAQKRVGFRWNLISYVCVSAMMVAIWFLSGRGHFWPAWVIVFWGISIVMQYFRAFHYKTPEEEYKRLKNRNR